MNVYLININQLYVKEEQPLSKMKNNISVHACTADNHTYKKYYLKKVM
jgi:hypothetical protein